MIESEQKTVEVARLTRVKVVLPCGSSTAVLTECDSQVFDARGCGPLFDLHIDGCSVLSHISLGYYETVLTALQGLLVAARGDRSKGMLGEALDAYGRKALDGEPVCTPDPRPTD